MTRLAESPPPESDSSEQRTLFLLRAASRGDPDAWTELYSKHRSLMRAILHGRIPKHLQARLDTEDVVQSAFFELSKRLGELKVTDGATFRRYLVTVLLNKLRDKLRHHGRARRDPSKEERSADATEAWLQGGEPPIDILERAERQAYILAQMSKQSPMDQDLILMRIFENLTWVEMAGALGTSEATVRRRTLDALERLIRTCL